VPPAGSKYDWPSSPFWGVRPGTQTVYIHGTTDSTWVEPDSHKIDYDAGTTTVTDDADFDMDSVKFLVKQPPLHPDP